MLPPATGRNRKTAMGPSLQRNSQLHIDPAWHGPLANSGLDSLETLLQETGGRCVSRHSDRTETYRLTLRNGQVVFLKKSLFTKPREILADLLKFRWPSTLVQKERLANERVAALGIATPVAIAYGQSRERWKPGQAVLVTLPLPGLPLDSLLQKGFCPEVADALKQTAAAIERLIRANLAWPDMYPRHIHIDDQGNVGFLDLERLGEASRWGGRAHLLKGLRRFFEGLHKAGGDDQCLRVVLDNLHVPGMNPWPH